MIRGIYISASGTLVESARQDVIANNLANADTVGFKRSETATRPFVDFLLSNIGMSGTNQVGPVSMGAQVDRTSRRSASPAFWAEPRTPDTRGVN